MIKVCIVGHQLGNVLFLECWQGKEDVRCSGIDKGILSKGTSMKLHGHFR